MKLGPAPGKNPCDVHDCTFYLKEDTTLDNRQPQNNLSSASFGKFTLQAWVGILRKFVLSRNETLRAYLIHTKKFLHIYSYSRGREPMARKPDVALLRTASGSLDIFLTPVLRTKLLL